MDIHDEDPCVGLSGKYVVVGACCAIRHLDCKSTQAGQQAPKEAPVDFPSRCRQLFRFLHQIHPDYISYIAYNSE